MTDAQRKARQNKHAAAYRARHADELRTYKREWQRAKRAKERLRLRSVTIKTGSHPGPSPHPCRALASAVGPGCDLPLVPDPVAG
jgi:hypothetical protein